jgi:putative transport protein
MDSWRLRGRAGPAPSKYWIVNIVRKSAALTLLATLALGHLPGKFKAGPFTLGTVTGTLIVGVLFGQLDTAISSQVKEIFFTMFLFAIGYSVGPQFLRGVAHDGAPRRFLP